MHFIHRRHDLVIANNIVGFALTDASLPTSVMTLIFSRSLAPITFGHPVSMNCCGSNEYTNRLERGSLLHHHVRLSADASFVPLARVTAIVVGLVLRVVMQSVQTQEIFAFQGRGRSFY